MLLRGQSLVGYRNYADDVVDAFVERSAENGIDIFRVFDALNYEPNLERAAAAVKRAGKHLQLTMCYTVTDEGRMGGPIYNLEYYRAKARNLRDMGADSVCIKDMGGLLAPYDAYELVSALKQDGGDLPVQLHCHYTSGMASMSALKAVEAGLDILDVCLAPLALRTSQPAVEPIAVALGGGERDPGVDLDKLLEIGERLEAVLPKYAEHMQATRAAVIDPGVLKHQIPGGMASNLVSQLREADAVDRLGDVLDEIVRTRAELGYPAARYADEPDGGRASGDQRAVRSLCRRIRACEGVRARRLRQARFGDRLWVAGNAEGARRNRAGRRPRPSRRCDRSGIGRGAGGGIGSDVGH